MRLIAGSSNSPSAIGRGERHRAALLIAGSLIWITGCTAASGGIEPTGAPTTAAARPAAKHTCTDVVWKPPASLGVVQTGRQLVGFGPTLLGLQSTWAGDGFTAETVAGGYVDDLTEAYDDLHVTGSLTLRPGVEADVLHGRLLNKGLFLVIWRDPAEEVPCDVHALLVTGADATQEEALLRGLH